MIRSEVEWREVNPEGAVKLLETGLPPEYHARLREYLDAADLRSLDRLFKRHSVNHRLRPNRVRRYLKAMRRHRWQPATETIKLDTQGVLRDGYNRLVAQVLADVILSWMVQTNLTEAEIPLLDCGAPRSAAESLLQREQGGVKEVNRMVAAARVFHYLQTSEIDLDNDEVGQVFRRNRRAISWAVNECRRRSSTRLAAVIGAFAFSHKAGPRKVEKLLAQILGDRDRPPGGAAFAIERLLEGPDRKISRAVYSPLTHKVLHAIQLYLQGAEVVSRLNDDHEHMDWLRQQRRASHA